MFYIEELEWEYRRKAYDASNAHSNATLWEARARLMGWEDEEDEAPDTSHALIEEAMIGG
jgi:hypothetical protein